MAGQIGSTPSDKPTRTAYPVNGFASATDLGSWKEAADAAFDKQLAEKWQLADDRKKLAAAWKAAAPWLAELKAARDAEKQRRDAEDKRRAAVVAAQEEWDQAKSDLERMACLPDSHAQAFLHLVARQAAWPVTPSLTTLQDQVGRRPSMSDTSIPELGRHENIGVAAAKLAHVLPPETECSSIGNALAKGREQDIREAAQDAADTWAGYYEDRRTKGVPARLANDEPWMQAQRVCPRWHRRKLRRESRKALAWYDCALRMTGPHSPAVSSHALAGCRTTWERSEEWAAGTAVRFEDGAEVPLDVIQKRARTARRAQMYTISRAMEHHADGLDYQAFFVTLTLPGEYHPYITGERAKDGTYPDARPNPNWNPAYGPQAQWIELKRRWELLRARLAKHKPLREYFGVSVPEPHQDGTPHLHVMMWLPRALFQRQTAHVLRDIIRDIAPGRQGRLEIVRKRPDRTMPDGTVKRYASPASYVMKYVMLSLDDEAMSGERGEDAERHRAWASTRGLRRMRLVGCHGSLRVWQRLWTSPDKEVLPYRADAARRAMRRSELAGELAKALEANADEPPDQAEQLRDYQAAAAAEALQIIGGLPGGDGRLKLEYEEIVTEYGKPSKRPVAVIEEVRQEVEETEEYTTPKRGIKRTRTQTVTKWIKTKERFPIRRQECSLVARDREEDDTQSTAVTVVASYPRAGAAPQPEANPEDLQAADTLENLIKTRESKQYWSGWCVESKQRVQKLRAGIKYTSVQTEYGGWEVKKQAA